MKVIWAHNLVCLRIFKHARKIVINIYFIVMGIERHINESGHHYKLFGLETLDEN
jgi:hypothetical protein